MPGMIVLTHNGLPPTNLPGGGLRRGYIGGNRVFLFGGPSEGISLEEFRRMMAPPPRTSTTTASPARKIAYYALPVCRYDDGYCGDCGRYPNFTKRAVTDQGTQVVIECSRCGHLMRPRSSLQ